MNDFTELMGELLEIGMTANPTTPYTACIIDHSGQILVTACNATHISPLYTAESLALHVITSEYDCQLEQQLTLIATAEMDDSSLNAIFRARRHGVNITQLVYGATRQNIKAIWNNDPNRPIMESMKQYPADFRNSISINAPVLQEDCQEAFAEAQKIIEEGQVPVKSLDLDQYWMAGNWLMDEWDDEVV